jgi:hypothetical protein
MEGSKKHYVDNAAQYSSAGLIIRQKEPKNLEAPFDRIDSYCLELRGVAKHAIRNAGRHPGVRVRSLGAFSQQITSAREVEFSRA